MEGRTIMLKRSRKRFQTYIEKTLPVIEHYEALNKVKKVLCMGIVFLITGCFE